MDFLRVIRSSFYDPAFYAGIRAQSVSAAIRIFAILGVIGIGVVMVIAYGGVAQFAYSHFPDTLESAYPNDLVITVAQGAMSINQPQPYYVKNMLSSFSNPDDPKYLAIFDGNDVLSGDLQQNSTFAIVKKNFAITHGSNNQEQVISFSKMQGTTTVEKSTVVGVIDRYKPYFVSGVLFGGAILFVILALFGTFFWVLFHLIYLLIPAALIFLFGLARGARMKYRESYMTAVYASIPVAILFYLLSLLKVINVEYAYTFVLLLVAVVNIAGEPKEHSAE